MKRLYRMEEGRKLSGVCGGIAEYLNVDPTMVRVVWAIATLFTVGVGVVGYIACSVIIPQKSEVIS